MIFSVVIFLLHVVMLVLGHGPQICPKTILGPYNEKKYRFVADGTDSGFSKCQGGGDIPHCVYTRKMKFYCMTKVQGRYQPNELEGHYESLKENKTETRFGKGGEEKMDIDLTGTNNAIKMMLYTNNVKVKHFMATMTNLWA